MFFVEEFFKQRNKFTFWPIGQRSSFHKAIGLDGPREFWNLSKRNSGKEFSLLIFKRKVVLTLKAKRKKKKTRDFLMQLFLNSFLS